MSIWHPSADKFATSCHLSVGQCIGYNKEKLYANHLYSQLLSGLLFVLRKPLYSFRNGD